MIGSLLKTLALCLISGISVSEPKTFIQQPLNTVQFQYSSQFMTIEDETTILYKGSINFTSLMGLNGTDLYGSSWDDNMSNLEDFTYFDTYYGPQQLHENVRRYAYDDYPNNKNYCAFSYLGYQDSSNNIYQTYFSFGIYTLYGSGARYFNMDISCSTNFRLVYALTTPNSSVVMATSTNSYSLSWDLYQGVFTFLPDSQFIVTTSSLAQYQINFSFGGNNPYSDGYNDGYSEGYNEGNLDGFNSGYQEGSRDGYNQGYADGLGTTERGSFFNLFGALADTPLRMLYSLFSFDLFGMSALVIVLSFLTGIFVIKIVKKFL